ncbi:putative Zn-dependent peptidase [Clostridium sp. CAG:793]|nr:putative Zn-dependent peptidase [Clostridium sp. CAG:793]
MLIKTNRFKTNLYAIFLTIPMKKEDATINSLIPAVLRRGTEKYPTQLEIEKRLEEMYGASFNCGVDKIGNYQVLKFYIEGLSDEYTEEKQNIEELLKEIIYSPILENGYFKKEYVEQEKENLRLIIESRKDNKARYAYERCIEEMFENEPYGVYKYGTVEDVEKITPESLYNQYKKILKNAQIDVFGCGNQLEEIEIPHKNTIEIKNTIHENKHKEIKEKADVTQGKLIIGLDTPEENKPAITMYNAILGGGANSKLFQNVREKASLAYSAGSSYIRRINSIFIKTGIKNENYEKTLEIIKKQLQDMKQGNITDKEFRDAKQLIISSLKLIPEQQEDLIAFTYDQKIFGENQSIDEYISNISKVTKENVIEIAQKIDIDTIYFLYGEEK